MNGMIEAPEAGYLPVPVDPQNATYLQFDVLQAQGYPVALVPCELEQVKAQYAQVGELGRGMVELTTYFQEWVTPQVTDPCFAHRIGELGLGAPALGLEERTQLTLENHPATLVKAVDWGEAHQIANYGAKLKAGIWPKTAAPMDVRRLLPPLFMAAMKRRQLFEGKIPLPKLQETDISAYKAFAEEGIQPANDELLRKLVVDYYKVLASTTKGFRLFRTQPEKSK